MLETFREWKDKCELESWSNFMGDKRLKISLRESIEFEAFKKEKTGDSDLEHTRGRVAMNRWQ